MDPTINPTPNPMSNPTPVPSPMPEPVAPVSEPVVSPMAGEPAMGAVMPEAPVAPVESVAPVASVEPMAPVEPMAGPAPVAPVAPTAPVNPVVTPGNPVPVNPVFQPGDGLGVAATDPIMMPEQPKAPDPIEEELKAPMKAAAPAPGSIGSAISGPSNNTVESAANPFAQSNTQSVAFNDPANQPEAMSIETKPKAKSNKTTLIALIIVAIMIVIGLAAVLAWQLMNPAGGNGSGSGSQNSSSNSSSNSNTTPSQTDNDGSNNSLVNNSSDGDTSSSSNGVSSADTIVFQDLQSEVEEDHDAMDSKFSGKTISITNVPLYVTEGSTQAGNITLGKMFFNLSCKNEDSLSFSSEDNGKQYTITGMVTYIGSTGVSLSNCVAVEE